MMGRRKGKKGQFFYSFDLDKVVPPEQIWSSGTMLSIHLRCTKQKIFANTSANTRCGTNMREWLPEKYRALKNACGRTSPEAGGEGDAPSQGRHAATYC